MKCQKCGMPVGNGDLFCPECGSKVEKKSNVKVVAAASVVTVFILAAIAVWVMSGASTDSEDKKKETTAEVTEDNNTEEDSITKENEAESEKNPVKEEDASEDQETEYVIAESSSKYLSDSDLAGLTLQEVNYAKNEIFARHGRKFKSAELQNYFESKSWYTGRYDPDDFDQNYSSTVLNDFEKKNAELLKKKEFAMNPDGYQLDK